MHAIRKFWCEQLKCSIANSGFNSESIMETALFS